MPVYTCYSHDLGSCGFCHKSRGRAAACLATQKKKYHEFSRVITEVAHRNMIGGATYPVNHATKARVREWSQSKGITPVFDRFHGRGARAANRLIAGRGSPSAQSQSDAQSQSGDAVDAAAEQAINDAMQTIQDQQQSQSQSSDSEQGGGQQDDKGEQPSPSPSPSSFIDLDALAKAVGELLKPDVERLAREVAEATEGAVNADELEEQLSKIFAKHLPDHSPESIAQMIDEKVACLKPDRFEVAYGTNGDQEVVEVDGRPHAAFSRALRAARLRQPCLLVGPAGCGKTTLGKQVAAALDMDFASISCSVGMSEGQLLGRLLPIGEGGAFEYVSTPFVDRYENGGVFLLDELDAADENVLIALHTGIDNGYLSVPNRTDNPVARQHPDFVLIAAANTFGKGANRQYCGRNALDEATLNRFKANTLELDYDLGLEDVLVRSVELLRIGRALRDAIDQHGLRRIVSMRELIQIDAAMTADRSYTMREAADQLVVGWTRDEVAKVRSILDGVADENPYGAEAAEAADNDNDNDNDESESVEAMVSTSTPSYDPFNEPSACGGDVTKE